MSDAAAEASRRRLDIFRSGPSMLVVAREGGGSLGTVFQGEIEGESEALGRLALEWLAEAEGLEPPASELQFPDDLMPESWQPGHWYSFMRAAELVALERQGDGHLLLRSYKNLEAVGEGFSHESRHTIDCEAVPLALGVSLEAALRLSRKLSQVRRAANLQSTVERPDARVLSHLERLGARLFERPPRPDIIEVAEGFFHVPAALRQLLFDVVWRRGTRVIDQAGTVWTMRWFPISTEGPRSAWPLMRLADTEGAEIVLRLDSESPEDPPVYQLAVEAEAALEPEDALGPASGPATSGTALSRWLGELRRE